MKDMVSGDIKMSNEKIENVIQRCRDRIDRSLDCNVGDIIRLIEEIEKSKQQVQRQQSYPIWHGFGSGD